MQPGGRRGNGAGPFGIDRLVALGILGARRVGDVGRQRHRAVILEHGFHRLRKPQVVEVALAAEHGRRHRFAHVDRRADGGRVVGADQDEGLVRAQYPFDEDLELAAGALPGVEPGIDDPGVVDHQHIVEADESRQVREYEVLERPAHAVQAQQTARAALRGGVLCDQLFGKRIIEFGDAHGCALYRCAQFGSGRIRRIRPACDNPRLPQCRNGGIGRRSGLKIRRLIIVRVRVPFPAPAF